MKSNIYIKDWLIYKPYDRQQASDLYYLRVANDVKKALVGATKHLNLKDAFVKPEELINQLSCFLVAYLEDLVSDTHLWNTFQKAFREKYNRTLPFMGAIEDYYDGEVNMPDLIILIWYFFNTSQDQIVFGHDEEWIIKSAISIFEILTKAWETAPENEWLRAYYQLGEKEDVFFEVRKLIEKIQLQSYLFNPDIKRTFLQSVLQLSRNDKDFRLSMLIWNQQTYTYHNVPSRLMGMYGNEWVAAYLGKSHVLYHDVQTMSRRISGAFILKIEMENSCYFEHITSGKSFEVLKQSLNVDLELEEGEIYYLDMVEWKSKWYLSGLMYKLNNTATFIESERNDLSKKYLFDALLDQYWQKPELKIELEIFRSINEGKQIAFLEYAALVPFLERMKAASDYGALLSAEEKSQFEDRMDTVIIGLKGNNKVKDNIFTVYFDTETGLEFASDTHLAFKHPDNPYFDEEKSALVFLGMVTQPTISKQLLGYFMSNNPDVVSTFSPSFRASWLQDLDFLQRFWKHKSYFLKAV